MPAPINPDDLRTYEEWRVLGYQVQQGSRHVARRMPDGFIRHGYTVGVPGVPLFSGVQVAPISRTPQGVPRRDYQQAPRRPRSATGRTTNTPTPSTQTWGNLWASPSTLRGLATAVDYTAGFATYINTAARPLEGARFEYAVMDEIGYSQHNTERQATQLEVFAVQRKINEYQQKLDLLERGGRPYVHPDDRPHPGLKKLNDLATKLKEK